MNTFVKLILPLDICIEFFFVCIDFVKPGPKPVAVEEAE
jgi:hypothetical protein